jgi:hypothetical protein
MPVTSDNPYGCNVPGNCRWHDSGKPLRLALVDELQEWEPEYTPPDLPSWRNYLRLLPITLAVTAWFFVCLVLLGYWGYVIAIPTTNAFFWIRAHLEH